MLKLLELRLLHSLVNLPTGTTGLHSDVITLSDARAAVKYLGTLKPEQIKEFRDYFQKLLEKWGARRPVGDG